MSYQWPFGESEGEFSTHITLRSSHFQHHKNLSLSNKNFKKHDYIINKLKKITTEQLELKLEKEYKYSVPFSSAFSSASATACCTISMPMTSLTKGDITSPIVPVPQHTSIRVVELKRKIKIL